MTTLDNTTAITEETTREELLELIETLVGKVEDLTLKLETKGTGRKEAVLNLLREGYNNIDSIAEAIGINNKNVSSQLTYLRKEGHVILSYKLDGKQVLEMR